MDMWMEFRLYELKAVAIEVYDRFSHYLENFGLILWIRILAAQYVYPANSPLSSRLLITIRKRSIPQIVNGLPKFR